MKKVEFLTALSDVSLFGMDRKLKPLIPYLRNSHATITTTAVDCISLIHWLRTFTLLASISHEDIFVFSNLHGMLVLSLFTDVMNHKPRFAWELYLKMETSGESFSLLQLIANDCYKVLCVLCDLYTVFEQVLGRKVMMCNTVKSKEKSKIILKNEIHAQTKGNSCFSFIQRPGN